jgi:xanthine/uracil permease
LNLPADYQQYMISSALIVTAIGSAFQITALRYRGFQLGTGLLSVVGTTFTIIPIAQSVFTVSGNSSEKENKKFFFVLISRSVYH